MMQRMNGTKCPRDTGGLMRRGVVLLAALLLVCTLMAGAVSATEVSVSTWEQLSGSFSGGNTITLDDDIDFKDNLTLTSGDVTLNLGNYNLSNTTRTTTYPIQITGGNLTIKGTGSINYASDLFKVTKGKLTIESGTINAGTDKDKWGSAVTIVGAKDDTEDYSVVTIGKDATLKSAGYVVNIAVNKTGGTNNHASYGVKLTVAGKLLGNETTASTNEAAPGIGVNGHIKPVTGHVPKIVIENTAQIVGQRGHVQNPTDSKNNSLNPINYNAGPAVYAAGYAEWTIASGAQLTGDEALSIKSGNFTINGGTFTGNGLFADPATSWGNGSESTGAALSVTTNHVYAKNVTITITGGEFKSENQSAFYEGPGSEEKNKGTALKKVDISGGTFTTNNSTLSAVTIQNSGNSTITGGISIKADGNNLLYRGVNLTSVADWTGDATNGYTLELDGENAKYKLMDAFSTTDTGIKITADSVTLDGNGKLITAKSPTEQSNSYSTAVSVTGKGATLKNLNLVADTTFKEPNGSTKGQYLTAVHVSPTNDNANSEFTLSDSTLNMSKAVSGNQTMVVRVAGTHKTVTITNNTIHGATSTNDAEHKDSGNLGTSFGIAVEGASISDKLTIEDNTIYPGIAGNSGSIGMRTYALGQGPTNSIVIDKNTIDFTYATGGEYFSGIHMDQNNVQKQSVTLKYIITNNTIQNLKEGNKTTNVEDSYKNAGIYLRKVNAATGTTITLDMHDNSISGELSETNKTTHNVTAFYANNVTFGASTIYNNTFNIENANVLNYVHLTDVTTQNQIKWNSTGNDKQHAGNWWGAWSEKQKSTTGYMTFADEATAKAAGLPVADLRPLVTVGTPTSTITIIGNLSIENKTGNSELLTATFAGGVSADFTWTVDPTGIISLSATTGSSVTYTPKKVGTTNLTVSSGEDGADKVSKTILITVYQTTEPKIDTTVTLPTQPGDNTTIAKSDSGSSTIQVSDDKKTATVTDTKTKTQIVITYKEPATTTGGSGDTPESVEGKVAAVVASYPQEVLAADPESGTTETSAYQLTLTLKNVTTILPKIIPAINATKEAKITALPGQLKVAAMIEAVAPAGHSLSDINKNISTKGIEIVFMIPKDSWIASVSRSKLAAYHIPDEGSVPDKINIIKYDDMGTYLNITVQGTSFSGIALAASTTPSTPVPTYTPVYSSGSGNMDGALRVLFNDGSATLSVVTGLSYGDKLTAPANPVKDGYTFAGWYKDEACTQAWSFSDGIPSDMTLYAKWTGGSSSSQSSSQQSGTTTQPTAKATSAPASTQSQSGTSATSAPVSTTAASGVSPTMTQAPAPVLGALLGLLAAGVLLRRRE